MSGSSGRKCIGMMKEVVNKWERRAPLAPAQVRELVKAGVRVLIEPSERRVFKDHEYESAGAELTTDLTPAHTILGINAFPPENLLPDRTYMVFTRSLKGDMRNWPLIDACMSNNVRLIDYEAIRKLDEHGGDRLVQFSAFAGYAGMVDCLRGVGERFMSIGRASPFLNVASAYMYSNLEQAKDAVSIAGERIKNVGLPYSQAPFTFVFTGQGRTSAAAQEILRLLPHQQVDPKELAELTKSGRGDAHKVFYCVTDHDDLVQPIEKGAKFDKEEYYTNPERYEPIFADRILPHASVVVNAMAWDRRFPRLITAEDVRNLDSKVPSSLMMVADLSRDVQGAIEVVQKQSTLDRPFYVYNDYTGEISDDMDAPGVLVSSLHELLPTEFARDASEHFSVSLRPFLEELAEEQYKDGRMANVLPWPVRMAKIVDNRQITPAFEYLQDVRKALVYAPSTPEAEARKKQQVTRGYVVKGHLFDTNFMSRFLDVMELFDGVSFNVLEWNMGLQHKDMSSAVVQLWADSEARMDELYNSMQATVDNVPEAKASIKPLTHGAALKQKVTTKAEQAADVAGELNTRYFGVPQNKVLVLGAGYVSGPVVSYLARSGRNAITVACRTLRQARMVSANSRNTTELQLDVEDDGALDKALRDADVVVCLVPDRHHGRVMKACIKAGVPMISSNTPTAEMQELQREAEDAGVPILAECGFDPGLDHVHAMNTFHDIKNKGGRVRAYKAVMGALPAAESADNPLGYKFTWSPISVLQKALRDARFRAEGEIVEVPRSQVLASAQKYDINPALPLEHFPSGDSESLTAAYGLPDADSMYRATARYRGWSALIDAFNRLGLLDESVEDARATPVSGDPWPALLAQVLESPEDSASALQTVVRDRLMATATTDRVSSTGETAEEATERAIECMKWLGLFKKSEKMRLASTDAPSVLHAFARNLEKHTRMQPGDRDMVFLRQEYEIEWLNGKRDRHRSQIISYGDDKSTALSRAVALPVAIAAQLVIDDQVPRGGSGLILPTHRDLYLPIIKGMASEGLKAPVELGIN